MSGGSKLTNKQAHALSMMQANPLGWLRHGPMEVRDLALINAHAVPFVKYGSQSFVRKLLDWTVENNENCMEIVAKMGGTVVGFDSRLATGAVNDLTYTLVNVNITATPKMIANEEISSRKWDILAMKMSEDYDGNSLAGHSGP
ncbi:uncharacterized protein PG998_001726 [Apiospora kogelbergensis]|uniref:uncharacterized protein n=1 Tax=Apiospora kogelbergensis TaxID=1337665 RepID=UPI00313261AB